MKKKLTITAIANEIKEENSTTKSHKFHIRCNNMNVYCFFSSIFIQRDKCFIWVKCELSERKNSETKVWLTFWSTAVIIYSK